MLVAARSKVNGIGVEGTVDNSLQIVAGNASGGQAMKFYTNSNVSSAPTNQRMVIANGGEIGIGVTSPTAALHLKAGTTTANTAALKFTEGARTTTAEDGAIEKDDAFYMTKTNAVRYGVGGTLNSQYTDVGNVTTGIDDLMSYTLPAGTLSRDGDILEFNMAFEIAANANLKTIEIHFGANIFSAYSATTASGYAIFEFKFVRRDATNCIGYVTGYANASTYTDLVVIPATYSGSILIKATGEGVATNDIVQRQMTVKYFPAN